MSENAPLLLRCLVQAAEAAAFLAKAVGAIDGFAREYNAEGNVDEAMTLWPQMTGRFPGSHAGVFGLAADSRCTPHTTPGIP